MAWAKRPTAASASPRHTRNNPPRNQVGAMWGLRIRAAKQCNAVVKIAGETTEHMTASGQWDRIVPAQFDSAAS